MDGYQIFTDATSDLAPELTAGLPSVEMIPMNVEIGGTEYSYGSPEGITAKEFYRLQRAGNFATTSQINPTIYFKHFEPCLRQGTDILYLCFSSGLSGTYQSAFLAVEELQQEYPERRIICIDTLAAAVGEGFLVREAAKKQREGLSIDELASWVMEHRLEVEVHRPLDEGGHAPAPILLIPALQDRLFLRRQVKREFLFFAHKWLLPGV